MTWQHRSPSGLVVLHLELELKEEIRGYLTIDLYQMGYGFVSESIRAYVTCVRESRVEVESRLWLEADMSGEFIGE